MNTIHALTVRTAAAIRRLGELQRRAEKQTAASPLLKVTLKDLADALEELQVANEQLRELGDRLGTAQADNADAEARFEEFVNAMPQGCLWTDESGVIREANGAAAALLNVAPPRLAGKPLSLFFTDRQRFFDALGALKAPDGGAVEMDMVVRPRERRARSVRVVGRRLAHDARWCWFLHPYSPESGAAVEPGSEPGVSARPTSSSA